MKTGTKIALLAGILLLAFGLTALQIAHHRGESFLVAPTQIRFDGAGELPYDQKDYTVCLGGEEGFAAKDVDSVKLDWLTGSVSVERWDGKEVVVREKAAVGLGEDERLRWRLRGGELSILPCANAVRDLPDKQLTVLIPQSLTLRSLDADAAAASVLVRGIETEGKLLLSAASGSLRAEDCRCGALRLESASGSQSLLRCSVSGDAEADLASGSFTAEELDCAALAVDGASGSQRISALECRSLSLSAASGSIRAEELRCGKVDVDGGSGSVRLSFAAAPEKVKVDAASGSVTLSFPKGTGLDLDFDSGSGKLHGEVLSGDLPVEVDTGSGSLTVEYK